MDDVARIADEAPTLRKSNTGVAPAPFTFTLSISKPSNQSLTPVLSSAQRKRLL